MMIIDIKTSKLPVKQFLLKVLYNPTLFVRPRMLKTEVLDFESN